MSIFSYVFLGCIFNATNRNSHDTSPFAGEHVVLDICENEYERILLIVLLRAQRPCAFPSVPFKNLYFGVQLNNYHKAGIG